MTLDTQILGLLFVALSQLVIFLMSFSSLKQRVKNLEETMPELKSDHDLLVSLDTKFDIIFSKFFSENQQ